MTTRNRDKKQYHIYWYTPIKPNEYYRIDKYDDIEEFQSAVNKIFRTKNWTGFTADAASKSITFEV